MLTIRTETPDDYSIIYSINEKAFGREVEPKLVDALRKSGELVLSLIAHSGDIPVAHIAFSEAVIDGGDSLISTVCLAPLAVLPEFQKQGFGSELTLKALDILKSRGIGIVFVIGHPGYYPRLGFVRASECGISWDHECPDEAFMVTELIPGSLGGIQGSVQFTSEFDNV